MSAGLSLPMHPSRLRDDELLSHVAQGEATDTESELAQRYGRALDYIALMEVVLRNNDLVDGVSSMVH